MNISIDARWEEFVENAVRSGRYGSASEVVLAGLRLVEEREAKLQDLRATLNAAIAKGGSHTSEDVMSAVRTRLDTLEKKRAS